MDTSILPPINAVLNATSTVLLVLGRRLARRGEYESHKRVMGAAFVVSSVFLVCYVVYHAQVGSVRFTGQGTMRTVYFAILISHTLLAVVIVPLVLVTLTRAVRERIPAHRKIARVTLPIWAYVSVTGVVIYWMLYRL